MQAKHQQPIEQAHAERGLDFRAIKRRQRGGNHEISERELKALRPITAARQAQILSDGDDLQAWQIVAQEKASSSR
jgi:hypothetical protein